jgi:hypothetical protein
VHDDGAGKVVKLLAQHALEEALLEAVVLVPDDALEEGIGEADDQRRGDALRGEPRALGDAARDDGGHCGGESAQEEEFDERQPLRIEAFRRTVERLGIDEEGDAVGDGVADEEISHRRYGEIDQDLAQRVDLVLVAHRTGFQEREAAVHGEHEHRAHQQELHVRPALKTLHRFLDIRHVELPPKARLMFVQRPGTSNDLREI